MADELPGWNNSASKDKRKAMRHPPDSVNGDDAIVLKISGAESDPTTRERQAFDPVLYRFPVHGVWGAHGRTIQEVSVIVNTYCIV